VFNFISLRPIPCSPRDKRVFRKPAYLVVLICIQLARFVLNVKQKEKILFFEITKDFSQSQTNMEMEKGQIH